MKRAAALFMYLSYKIETHYWLQISLKNWLWLAIVGPPVLAWVRRVSWAAAISVSAAGLLLLAGTVWARRRQYVIFEPDEPAAHDAGQHLAPLQVDEQVRCWAFGCFAVQGKTRYVINGDAQMSFVRTREHIVMAYIRRTRFLLLATALKKQVGWWYAFVRPDRLEKVQTGALAYGLKVEPALNVRYRPEQEPAHVQELYLVFEDAEARQRVLDDLCRDLVEQVRYSSTPSCISQSSRSSTMS